MDTTVASVWGGTWRDGLAKESRGGLSVARWDFFCGIVVRSRFIEQGKSREMLPKKIFLVDLLADHDYSFD